MTIQEGDEGGDFRKGTNQFDQVADNVRIMDRPLADSRIDFVGTSFNKFEIGPRVTTGQKIDGQGEIGSLDGVDNHQFLEVSAEVLRRPQCSS